jgi:hypothetical protein
LESNTEYNIIKCENLEDTNVVIRSRKSKKDRQYNDQKINNDLQHTTQKDRQYNDQKTNNDLQHTTQKDRQYNDQKTNNDLQRTTQKMIQQHKTH